MLIRTAFHTGVDALVRRLTSRQGVILMLHRTREAAVDGLALEDLRSGLEWMHRDGNYLPVPLTAFFRPGGLAAIGRRKPVAFSIDDGYADQLELMGPVFERYDVPVTLFATTGFIDGRLWMWWDRVRHAFQHGERPHAAFQLPATGRVVVERSADRLADAEAFIERLKRVPDGDRLAAIAQLGEALDVDVPETAPAGCAAASWEAIRHWESRGLYSIAPHTVTHPILSQVSDVDAREEIVGSWQQLQQQVRDPAPIFCYPNGTAADFGAREMRMVGEAGLLGAVSAEPGVVRGTGDLNGAPVLLPRNTFPGSLESLRLLMSGLSVLRSEGPLAWLAH